LIEQRAITLHLDESKIATSLPAAGYPVARNKHESYDASKAIHQVWEKTLEMVKAFPT